MNFDFHLRKIQQKFEELSKQLTDVALLTREEYVKAIKEYSEIEQVITVINKYHNTISELEGLKDLSKEQNLSYEMQSMIEEECLKLNNSVTFLEKEIKLFLLPKDEADDKGVVIEIRAGSGGEEAALFASQLFIMYQRYSHIKGWRFETLSIADTGIGGFKEASALISGSKVFAQLKFESGVHRVQRVPETESNGRIHTSAATVAVLPEAEEIDVKLEEKDLKIDTYRSSGAGGQHVNTTDSAVRITHLPTGIVVSLQDEKSQHKNKSKALKILRSRIYEVERQKKQQERALSRKIQIGSGDRSERIRTYNFPQSRITDHRINLTVYKIELVMREGQLDEIINALIKHDEIKKLEEVIS